DEILHFPLTYKQAQQWVEVEIEAPTRSHSLPRSYTAEVYAYLLIARASALAVEYMPGATALEAKRYTRDLLCTFLRIGANSVDVRDLMPDMRSQQQILTYTPHIILDAILFVQSEIIMLEDELQYESELAML